MGRIIENKILPLSDRRSLYSISETVHSLICAKSFVELGATNSKEKLKLNQLLGLIVFYRGAERK